MAKKRKKAPKPAEDEASGAGGATNGEAQEAPTAKRRVLTHRCSGVGWASGCGSCCGSGCERDLPHIPAEIFIRCSRPSAA